MIISLTNVPCFVIHRQQDIERESCIVDLEAWIGTKIQREEGIDGSIYQHWWHPWTGTTTPAEIGCLMSHINVLNKFPEKAKYICLFEDDAEGVGDFDGYLERVFALGEPDIIYLGINEIVEGEETADTGIKKVSRTWGAHAVIFNQKAVTAILKTHNEYINKGFALPADWLYNYAIKECNLTAYAPIVATIRQKPGLISKITGKMRKSIFPKEYLEK